MEQIVRKIANKIFPDKRLRSIEDKGLIIKRNFLMNFADGEKYFVKFNVRNEWSNLKHEENVIKVFENNDIPVPPLIFHDETNFISPYPYIIQKQISGLKLSDIYYSDEYDFEKIFESVGVYYSKIHSVKNDVSGLWSLDEYTERRFPISPVKYMYDSEISRGSGFELLKKGVIPVSLYEKIDRVWSESIEYLEQSDVTMIHASAFLWNVYVDISNENEVYVSKVTSLGDVMWWDPMWDVATLLFPPFFEMNEKNINSFIRGYGNEIEYKKVYIYGVMQTVSALNGIYMEPKSVRKENWKKLAIERINGFLDKIEVLSR